MNIQKYLDRIKYYSPVELTKEVMFSLQKQHSLNIPFENLDIHYGKIGIFVGDDSGGDFLKITVSKKIKIIK